MSRAERRRAEREAARRRDAPLIVGDGIAARSTGMRYEPVYRAPLPTKIPGKHRWIATAAYRIHDIDVERAEDPDHQTFLDQENMIQLAIGCWDCEQVLGVIHAGSHCPADVQED